MSKVLTEEEVLSLLAKVASLHPWRHEVNFLRDYITTLQSERDALLALGRKWHTMPLYGLHQPTLTYCANELEALLSTPASGEPARKP